jgi:hypothetical protein
VLLRQVLGTEPSGVISRANSRDHILRILGEAKEPLFALMAKE